MSIENNNESNEQYDSSQININLDILQAKLDSNEDLAGLKDEITGLTDNKEVLSERLDDYNYQNIIKEFIGEVDTTKPLDEQKDQIENFEAKKNCLQVFVALNVLGGVYQGAINESMVKEGSEITALDKDKVRSIVEGKNISSFQGALDSVDPNIFDNTEGKIFNWLNDNSESSFVTDLISDSDYSEMQSTMKESMYGQDGEEGLIDAYQESINMNLFDEMMHYGENALQRAQYYAEEGIEKGSQKAKELSEWAKDNPKQAGLGAGSIALGYMLIKKVFGNNNSSGGLISSVTGWMKNNKLLTVLGGTGVFFGLNKFLGGTANAESNDGVETSTSNAEKSSEGFEKLSSNEKEKYNTFGKQVNDFYNNVYDFDYEQDNIQYNGNKKFLNGLGEGQDKYAGTVPYIVNDSFDNINEMVGYSGVSNLLSTYMLDSAQNTVSDMFWSKISELYNNEDSKMIDMLDKISLLVANKPLGKILNDKSEEASQAKKDIVSIFAKSLKTITYTKYMRKDYQKKKLENKTIYKNNDSTTYEKAEDQSIENIMSNPNEYLIKENDSYVSIQDYMEDLGEKDILEIENDEFETGMEINQEDKENMSEINTKRQEFYDTLESNGIEDVKKDLMEYVDDEYTSLWVDGIEKHLPVVTLARIIPGIDKTLTKQKLKKEVFEKLGGKEYMTKVKEQLGSINSEQEAKKKIDETLVFMKETMMGTNVVVEKGTFEHTTGVLISFGGGVLSQAKRTLIATGGLLEDLLGEEKVDLSQGGEVALAGVSGLTLYVTGKAFKHLGYLTMNKGVAKMGLPGRALFERALLNGGKAGKANPEVLLRMRMLDVGGGLDYKNAFKLYKKFSFTPDKKPSAISKFVDDVLLLDSNKNHDALIEMIEKGDWKRVKKMLSKKFMKDARVSDKLNIYKYTGFRKRKFGEFVFDDANSIDEAIRLYNNYGQGEVNDVNGLVRKIFVESDNISGLGDEAVDGIARIISDAGPFSKVDSHDLYIVLSQHGDNINDWDKFMDFVSDASKLDDVDTSNIVLNSIKKWGSVDISQDLGKTVSDLNLNTNHKWVKGLKNKAKGFLTTGDSLYENIRAVDMVDELYDYRDVARMSDYIEDGINVDQLVVKYIDDIGGNGKITTTEIANLKKQASDLLDMYNTGLAPAENLRLADNVGEFKHLVSDGDNVNSLATKILSKWGEVDGENYFGDTIQREKAKRYAQYMKDNPDEFGVASKIDDTVDSGQAASKAAQSADVAQETTSAMNKAKNIEEGKKAIKGLEKSMDADQAKAFYKTIDSADGISDAGRKIAMLGQDQLKNLSKLEDVDEIKGYLKNISYIDDSQVDELASAGVLNHIGKASKTDDIKNMGKVVAASDDVGDALKTLKSGMSLAKWADMGFIALDVIFTAIEVTSALNRAEEFEERNVDRAQIERNRANFALLFGGIETTTGALMATPLLGPAGIAIVAGSVLGRSTVNKILDIQSAYNRNYEDYKNKYKTQVKNSIIALQAAQENIDIGWYNRMGGWMADIPLVGDPNYDENDPEQAQKYACRALVHFDVAEDIEMGWLVSDKKLMNEYIDKLQDEGEIENEEKIEFIQKQRAKFEAQVKQRAKYIQEHMDEYMSTKEWSDLEREYTSAERSNGAGGQNEFKDINRFEGFDNIDELMRDSKIYEREIKAKENWLEELSISHPMLINDLWAKDVIDMERETGKFSGIEIESYSDEIKEEDKSTKRTVKVDGSYSINKNGDIQVQIDKINIIKNIEEEKRVMAKIGNRGERKTVHSETTESLTKSGQEYSSNSFVEKLSVGQTIDISSKDKNTLQNIDKFDYHSESKKYGFNYDEQKDFDFEKSQISYENKLKNPKEKMGLEDIPENAFEKLDNLYEKYPIECQRLLQMSYSYSYSVFYPDNFEYLSKFMDYKKSYPTIKGDINEKQTQNMHNFDLRATNDIESFIKNFEFTENGYTNGEIKQSLADGNFELYTSSSIENDLGWSDSPVQNVIYRIACEVHGYDGKNKMIELQNFFSEDQKDNRGIYYNGSVWRMRTVGIGFTSKRIDEYTIEGQKAWMNNLKDSLLNRSKSLVDQDEDAGETLISGIMTEQIVDIINQEKEIIDNKSSIEENIQKYIQNHSNRKYIQLPMDILIKSTRAGISNIGKYMYKYENNKIKAISQESIKDNESERPDFVDSLSYVEGSELTQEHQEYMKNLDMKKNKIMDLYESHKNSHVSGESSIVGKKIFLAPDEDFQNYFEDLLSEYEDFKNDFKSRGEDKRQEYIKKANWDEKLEKIHIDLLSVGEPPIEYEDIKIFEHLSQTEPVSIDFDNGKFEVQNIIQDKFDSGIQDELKEYTKNVGIKDGKLVYVKDSNQQGIKTIDSLEKISSEQNKNLTQKGYNTILKSILQKRLSKSPNLSMGSEIERLEIGDIIKSNIIEIKNDF